MKKIFFIAVFVAFHLSGVAQDNLLTIENAVQIALVNNQSVKAAKLSEDIAQLQVFKGNAGMRPRLDYNANVGSAFNRVKQELSNGTSTLRPNGRSFTPNTNVAFSWLLYDGKRMFATYQKLGLQSELSSVKGKQTNEQVISAVMKAYYEIVRQKQTLKTLNVIIKYYQDRVNIAQQRWEFGKGSKLDFLQSQVDLNTQKAEAVRVNNALINAKTSLNGILERDLATEYEVSDFPPLELGINTLDELKDKARQANKDLLLSKKNIQISQTAEKEAESLRKPRVTLNSSYGFSLNSSNAGFILINQNLGLNTSISATWNIFNGEITRRQIQTAKLNTKLLETQQEDVWAQISSLLRKAYNQFQTDKQLLELEEANLALAEENLNIAFEKFKLGSSTILELNQAQQSFDNVSNRLVTNRYNLKISELEVLRLSGFLN